jgi:hypothetical protein
MKQSKFPRGWDKERVRRVLAHYEQQTEAEAVAEDEASFEDPTQAVMEVPKELVPAIRELIAKRQAQAGRASRSKRRPNAGRA